jgi:aspartyl-tRNA(Asn)/glutamyl-tRNA(Gln) amidotransferase subunit C
MIHEAEVLRVAKLARIQMKADDLAKTQKKISTLVEHFKLLEACSTQNVEALFHMRPEMLLRADIPEPALSTEEVLQNAPDRFEGSFRLPKVVGGAE